MIEEERKRVEELKRRVQDEVRAEWEQNRQRQNNGYQSHNSVGSEDSSMGSSDVPSDSMSSEDVEKIRQAGSVTNGITILPPIADVNPELMDSMVSKSRLGYVSPTANICIFLTVKIAYQ